MKDCLSVTGLTKSFRGREVVTQATFTIKQGTTFALVGANGDGKTTLIHMVATVLDKSGGRIVIDGNDIDVDKEKVKELLGVVFQEDVLDGPLSVKQNLYYRGGFYTKSNRELAHRIKEVLSLFGISHLEHKNYGILSGGQKRMVQIARAVLTKPKLLILDEPTQGLDPDARRDVWKILKKLQSEQNMTIFYTTHYLEETRYAAVIGTIREGKVSIRANSGIRELNNTRYQV